MPAQRVPDEPSSAAPPIPALTGLRGIAAALVAWYHLWHFAGQPAWRLGPLDLTPLAACGYFGVDLFFVLSGFLLGQPFIRARMQAQAPPSLPRFWLRRARRVLPALWIQLALLFAIGWIVHGVAPATAGELFAQATLSFNLFDVRTLNPVYWSLPIEWDFYLVLPLLALLFARGTGRPWGLPLLLALVLAFRLACVWAWQDWGLDGLPFARWIVQLPGRIDQFVLGMVAAWVVLRRPGDATLGRWLAGAGLVLVLALMGYCAAHGDGIIKLVLPQVLVHYSALGLGFAALVAGAALGPGRALGAVLQSRALVFTGTISYSLYLWHYPVLEALRWAGAHALLEVVHGLPWWLAATACMLLVATASYYSSERPWLPRAPSKPA